MATLYVVSTPVGNLSDLSERAAAVLDVVSHILAEDTRRSRILTDHVGVRTPLVSLHAHNESKRVSKVLSWLDGGEDVALVSDAGTPLISDPGARLVERVLEAGHEIVPIPGPSAVLAALVGSGLPTTPFAFLGFVPRKGKDRNGLLDRISTSTETVVLFESPERLVRFLESLIEVAGGARRIAVARELTKVHEAFFRGTLNEGLQYYRENPPRGEVTVVIGPTGPTEAGSEVDALAARALVDVLLERGMSASEAAREVAQRLGISKNIVYEIAHSAADEISDEVSDEISDQ